MSITSLRGSTLPNKSFRAGQAKTKNVVTIAPDTATTFANGASISAGGGGGGGPTISNVSVTDSGYILSNTTPYIDSVGGYIKITGTGFAAGCTVYVGGNAASSTTFVSATEVRAQVGAAASNAQAVYVVNTDSSVGIKLNAITYSGTPSWSTGATLTSQLADFSFSIPLSATSDSAIVYTLASGSSTPSGTTLFSNGVFAGTVTGITNDTNYSFTVVATDVENQLSARAFTVSVASGDTYFNTTTLLLNGEANVWITDSSTNNFLPTTIAGDTKPTAFSPYNTSWSAFFDGTGDYLTFPELNISSSTSFTIEFWFYWSASPSTYSMFVSDDNGNSSKYIAYNVSGATLDVQTGGSAGTTAYCSFTPILNTWYHLAFVRNTNTVTIYVNGVAQAMTQATQSGTFLDQGTINYIGRWGGTTPYAVTGYMSNFRAVVGLAVYTGNFTPSTSILGNTQSAGSNVTAITSGSTFLSLQNNRFVDNGVNAYTITRFGDTAIRSFGPFTETDTTTGSAYFDGSGDYLYFPSNSVYTLGTNDHCIEFWMYPDGAQSQYSVPWYYNGSILYYFSVGSDSNQAFLLVGGGSPWSLAITILNAEYVRILNNWVHVAITRSGTAFRVFFNGRLVGYGTTAQSISAQTSAFSIGWDGTNATTYYKGWITDFRLINGSIPAAYQTSSTTLGTTIFTPPTSSLSRVANTQLLTLQYRTGENNHRFVNEAGIKHPLTRAGQVSQGSFSPFSPAGWSHYFDGSSYYDFTASTTFNEFLTGDFTVECWLYYTGTDSFSGNPTALSVVATWSTSVSYEIEVQSGGVVRFAAGNSIPIDLRSSGAGLITANAWYHVAAARASGVTRLFINGANVAAHSGSVSISQAATNMRIGGFPGGGNRWSGYISDLRIVKGQAAYTANFTPATSSLTTTSQGITSANVFLGCNTNRFIDANTTPKTISSFTSAPKVQAFSPFRATVAYSPATHGGSAFFDGSGDYITTVSTTSTILPTSTTNTFTIDGWLYPTALGALAWIIGDLQPTGGSNNVAVDISASNFIELYWYDGAAKRATSTAAVVLNQWNYFAIVVNANAITIYVNSTTAGQGGTTTLTTRSLGTSGWAMGVWNSASYYTGYMSGIRWTNGVARTISSIPTAPPSLDANTSVLMNFTQGGVVDASARNVFETLGDAKISNAASKFGIGSLYFDGTSDGIYQPYNPLYAFGTGNFTIEFWMNFSSKTNYQTIMSFGYTTPVTGGWIIQTGNGNGNLIFYFMNAGTATAVATESGSTVNTGTWYHIMIIRSGGNTKIYRDGSQVATGADANNYSPTGAAFYIGGGSHVSFSDYFFSGYLDDIRITRGARTVTVPTSALLTK